MMRYKKLLKKNENVVLMLIFLGKSGVNSKKKRGKWFAKQTLKVPSLLNKCLSLEKQYDNIHNRGIKTPFNKSSMS